MKRLDPLSWFMIFGAVLMPIVMFSSFKSLPDGHGCRWPQCPYKGVTDALAHRSVSAYVGEAGTDAYYIDILHLQYPNDEYEQLETRLFNNK